VDLHSSPSLIPGKLLILQFAKMAKMAETANLSYNFVTVAIPVTNHSRPARTRKIISRFAAILEQALLNEIFTTALDKHRPECDLFVLRAL
jgi:hypothetical protein